MSLENTVKNNIESVNQINIDIKSKFNRLSNLSHKLNREEKIKFFSEVAALASKL